jgi:hypothetical protein
MCILTPYTLPLRVLWVTAQAHINEGSSLGVDPRESVHEGRYCPVEDALLIVCISSRL